MASHAVQYLFLNEKRNKTLKRQLLILIVFAVMISCKSGHKTPDREEEKKEAGKQNNELSLIEKGIPVNFKLSSNTSLNKGSQLIQWNVIAHDSLPIEVAMWDTKSIFSLEEIIKEDKNIMSQEEGYEIISETQNGYIYKVSYEGIDDYGFYFALYKNDRIIEFSPAIEENKYFSLEEVKKMFNICNDAY